MRKLFRRIRYWIHNWQGDPELAEELEFHRTLREDRAMGNMTMAREDARAVWIWPWLESVWQDAAYAVRTLRRQPGFALVAVLTLAIGIGLNTSLFTVFNALAFRPWPVKDPARVVTAFSVMKQGPGGFGIAEYRYLAERAKSFSGLIAMQEWNGAKLDQGKVSGLYVSGNYFRVLGVQMERGRGFLDVEDKTESPEAVAVVSYALWKARFGEDPEIVGRRIRLDDVPVTVVGVASRDFAGTSPGRSDLWVPLSAMQILHPNDAGVRDLLTKPNYCCSSVAGRLGPEVRPEQARAELELLRGQFFAQFKIDRRGAVLLSGTQMLANPGTKRSGIIPVFLLMFAGVTLVLLLACANVGNLLLARAAARRREIAIRLSVGAGRGRVIRQLLTESLVLACLAAGAGVAIAYWLPSYVVTLAAGPVGLRLKPDGLVLAYSLALASLACLAFGLAPALHATRPDTARSLSGGDRLMLRGALLAVQVAISVVLLVTAGLMARGIQRARSQDPGFAIKDVSVISFDLPASSYNGPRKHAFFTQLAREVEGVSEARQFGFASNTPLSNRRQVTSFRKDGESASQPAMVTFLSVSSGYFNVLRIPIVVGRNFEPAGQDRKVILINETAARRYWPGESPVGKTIYLRTPSEIVGVVKDAYTSDLSQIEPLFYQPIDGAEAPEMLVREAGLSQAVAAIAKRIDSRVEVRVAPLSENLDRWLAGSRIGATLAAWLGAFALLLASIGIFGVFAYVVQQRTREIGIRMALGARPGQVIGLVVGSHSRPLGAGIALGLLGALGASRLLVRYLYGLSPLDVVSYGVVIALLALAGAAATIVPARRASRIDPATALRWD
jgi:predicted permease